MAIFRDGRAEGDVLTGGPVQNVVEGTALARNHEVGFTGGEGLRLEFLAEDVDVDFAATFLGQALHFLFADGKDTAGTAGAVVYAIGIVLQLVSNGNNGQVCQQLDIVTRGKVFTSFGDVVLFIELP